MPPGGCGGTVGGCVVPKPGRPPNLNGSLLTPEFAFLRNASARGSSSSRGVATAAARGWEWATHPGVWVVYNESSADSGLPGGFPVPGPSGGYWHGELSVGYGGDHKGLLIGGQTNRTEVGPELGLGWALGDAYRGTGQQVRPLAANRSADGLLIYTTSIYPILPCKKGVP